MGNINCAADQRFEGRINGHARQEVKPAILDVAQPRRETESEQVAEAEYVISCAAGVGVVFGDLQAGLMIEQPIEDVGRLACGSGNNLGVERAKLIEDMGIDLSLLA